MLKTKDGAFAGPAARWRRALAAALLAAAVVGASAMRCPAQKAGAPPVYAVAFADGGTVGEKDAAAPEPFDVPYLPPDAMGVVCFRPSAALGRPALKHYAEAVDKAIPALCKEYGMPRAFSLPVAEIAQVTMTMNIKTNKKAKTGQTALVLGTPATIRAAKDFDWAAEVKALLPDVKEVRHGDRIVYQLPTEGPLARMSPGIKMCCYVPDGRTIVFDVEERLAKQIEHPAAAPVWAADFKRVDRGIAALVFDNRDGAWGRELSARDKPEPELAPFVDHTSWVVFGASADDGVTCDAAIRFDDEETAAKAAKAIGGWLAAARASLATFPEIASYSLLKSLVEKPDLKRDGASIRIRGHADGDATEWIRGVLDERNGQ